MMDAVIEKPVFPGAFTGKPVSRLTLQDIGAESTEKPPRLRHTNATPSLDEAENVPLVPRPFAPQESDAKGEARQILRDALERYRRPDGYEGYLVEAAWQLEQIGCEAWPVLDELVLAGTQECEYFLGAIVRLEGVAPQRRLTALLAAARNPDANVRSRLLELLEEMPGDLRRELLRELTAKSRPDDSVTDRARDAGHEQAS